MAESGDVHWPDIEDPREQIEAMLGHKLFDWQWDWIQHVVGRGEKLVPVDGRKTRYKWAPIIEKLYPDWERPEGGWQHYCSANEGRLIGLRNFHKFCAYGCGVERPQTPADSED